MALLVSDCPRCGAKRINFSIVGASQCGRFVDNRRTGISIDYFEIQCVCAECRRSTLFKANQATSKSSLGNTDWRIAAFNLKDIASIEGVVSPADLSFDPPPEYLPSDIETAFNEGSKCLSIGCFNASATMFRLCLDFATKALLPPASEEPNSKIRRSLGLRLNWLFDHHLLPEALRDLAECVKDDGNDGAHEGILDKESALDLRDFAFLLLERIYTEKARLEEAKRRRDERRNNNGS